MDESKDRRKFLKLLLVGGATAISGTAAASTKSSEASPDKIKMLTEDGQLVEIDKEVLEQLKTGKKAAIKEIQEFVKSPKDNCDEG